MPPVPSLPQSLKTEKVQTTTTTGPTRGAYTATSLGIRSPPVRVASQKLGKEIAPAWFGAAHVGDPGNVRRTDPAMASPPSSPPQPPAPEELAQDGVRSSSRASSINFSYPARMRVGSPPISPVDTRSSMEFPLHPTQGQASSQSGSQERHPQRSSSEPRPTPRRSQTAQATVSSKAPDQPLVYDPNSRRMIPKTDLLAVEQAIQDASEKPKKKKQTVPNRAGSHLAQGTIARSKSDASAVQRIRARAEALHAASDTEAEPPATTSGIPAVEEYQYEAAVKALIPSPRTEATKIEQQNFHAEPTQPPVSLVNDAPRMAEVAPPIQTIRRQPSMVKEEPELEDEEHGHHAAWTDSDAVGVAPSSQQLESHPPVESVPPAHHTVDHVVAETQRPGVRSPSLIDTPAAPAAAGGTTALVSSSPEPMERIEPKMVAFHPSAAVPDLKPVRTKSNSPPRQARFGSVSENLMVRHNPPPRSISPRKSAMKPSPSRGASPSDDTSEASTGFGSQEEAPLPRKKSVRVSFDESAVVVGESAAANQAGSPALVTPQATTGRRPWYSNIGRSKKKEFASLDDDEVMQPRPVLPSFGSVRDKKPRDRSPEEAERALVRPSLEPTNSPSLPATPILLPDFDGPQPESGPVGQSSDHAIGSLLQQEQESMSKFSANTSRFREPLPPVVTSVEGSGYISESAESDEADPEYMAEIDEIHEATSSNDAVTHVRDEPEAREQVAETSIGEEKEHSDYFHEAQQASDGPVKATQQAVPAIAVTQASPSPTQERPHMRKLDVPGGFPEDESDGSMAGTTAPVVAVAQPAQLRQHALEPSVGASDALPSSQLSATVLAANFGSLRETTDDDSSVYSDAYEDLSDLEGDGFQSLNAVLEAPVPQPMPQYTKPVASSDSMSATAPPPPPAYRETAVISPKMEPEISAASTLVATQPPALSETDWENAKAYWRSLTADKRAQLEKEAREDAAVEGDLEDVQSSPKPRKKKSIERRNSERKALAVHVAQHIMAQHQEDGAVHPERSYMIKPGTKWTEPDPTAAPIMRTTLRSPPPQQQQQPGAYGPSDTETHTARLRKSLRTNGATAWSPDSPEQRDTLSVAKAQRPMSMSPKPSPPVLGKQTKPRPMSSSASAASAAIENYYPPSASNRPQPKRRDSTSSESSFKRARAALGGGGFGFRKSLRQPSPAGPPPEASKGNKLLRALSPASSPFRRSLPPADNSPQGAHIRHTMRDGAVEAKSGGMRMPSFGFSSGTNKRVLGSRTLGGAGSSRFNDSSDEDGRPAGSGFRSRFEDSSDDDVPAMPLAVPKSVRTGVPAAPTHRRNQLSNASTALSEEHELNEPLPNNGEEQPARIGKSQKIDSVRRSGSGRGNLVNSHGSPTSADANTFPEAHSPTSRRGSFMNVLRRKKPDSHSKISRPETMESAARRDTQLERSPSQLRGIRRSMDDADLEDGEDLDQVISPRTVLPSPKLQKRVASLPPQRSGFWSPHGQGAEHAAGDEHVAELGGHADAQNRPNALRRPTTSGNLGTRTLSSLSTTMQPAFLQRRTASSGVLSTDSGVEEALGKKKKKFGTLRKMFRLD